MSVNLKAITLSTVGVLTAGGVFLAANYERSDPAETRAPASVFSATKPGTPMPEGSSAKIGAEVQEAMPADVREKSKKAQQQVSAPKKLTREQLLPPPPTEAEKLQRAAEQESNF